MFTAFCNKPECEWEHADLFSDPVEAFNAVGIHLADDHGAKLLGLRRTPWPDLVSVVTDGDGADMPSRAYIAERVTLADRWPAA